MMIRSVPFAGLMLASVLGLTACSSPERRADEPKAPVEGGIGGTGIELAAGEGGIGGTGAPTAAAVGTVTGFGSIHINGVRVVFPESGCAGSVCESDVDLGETLEILGVLQSDGTVRPTDAMFRFPIVGRIDSVSADGVGLSIIGAQVTLEQGALVVDATQGETSLRTGDMVQVSGLWRGDAVIASRIEQVNPATRSSVMGRVEAGSAPGTVRINGVTVDYGTSTPPQNGWTVRVTGSHEARGLIPYATERSLMETVPAPVPDVTIEGYLEPRSVPTGYGIGGFGREFDAESKIKVLAGDRALFIGSLEGGEFRARHGLRLPDNAEARRQRVEAVRNGYAPAGALPTR